MLQSLGLTVALTFCAPAGVGQPAVIDKQIPQKYEGLHEYARIPQKAEPPPQSDPSNWSIKSPEAARSAAAAFVFGDAKEAPPPTIAYPYRKEWAALQVEMGYIPPPERKYPKYVFVDSVLEQLVDPWTPYVGRADGRKVFRVRWKALPEERPKPAAEPRDEAAEQRDLRYDVEITAWIDPADGAFLKALIRHDQSGVPNSGVPSFACPAEATERDLWGRGPEFWRACLTKPPKVGLVQALEAGFEQVGGARGDVAMVHAVDWVIGLGSSMPAWTFQIWRSAPGPILGPQISHPYWVVRAETGQWDLGTGGPTCPNGMDEGAPQPPIQEKQP